MSKERKRASILCDASDDFRLPGIKRFLTVNLLNFNQCKIQAAVVF
jgi:hypothetical protein